jgi:hypothetical protein
VLFILLPGGSMRDFRTIIDILKMRIAKEGTKERIYDKDIAKLLEIEQSKFATIKKRNSMPYAELLHYCKRENLSCCELFFD